MNELDVSMMRARSGPVPWNAAPASATTVRRSDWGTDCTSASRLVSSSVVETGTEVSGVSISEPLRR